MRGKADTASPIPSSATGTNLRRHINADRRFADPPSPIFPPLRDKRLFIGPFVHLPTIAHAASMRSN